MWGRGGERWGEVGRDGERWGEMGRDGEMWGREGEGWGEPCLQPLVRGEQALHLVPEGSRKAPRRLLEGSWRAPSHPSCLAKLRGRLLETARALSCDDAMTSSYCGAIRSMYSCT